MYDNIFQPIRNIERSNLVYSGGLCWIIFFLWEDVAVWPPQDPVSGVIETELSLKEGASFYVLKVIDKGRIFKEDMKSSTAGPYHEQTITATFPGGNTMVTLSLSRMQFHQFGLLFKERNGEMRLIGCSDAGADLSFNYTSSDLSGSRKRELQFSFDHPLPAPLYSAPNIIVNDEVIPLEGSSTTNILYEMKLIEKFKIGTAGSPMAPGEETYNAPAGKLVNKEILVFIDGIKILNYSADPSRRYVVKNLGDNHATIHGGVMKDEVVEIYSIL